MGPKNQGPTSKHGKTASTSKQGKTPSTGSNEKSYMIVILATPPSHNYNHFMIGDFAGIKYHLNRMGLVQKENFWSTIKLEDYALTRPTRDIKIRGEKSEKVVYSALKAAHRHQDDYTFVPENQIKGKFISWLKEMNVKTEPGDAVTMIIVSHGSISKDYICFGDSDQLMPSELKQLLSYFKKGVQVNVITNACGSGALGHVLDARDRKNRLIIAGVERGTLTSGNGLIGWTKDKSNSGRFRSSFFIDVIIKALGAVEFDKKGPTMERFKNDLKPGVTEMPEGPGATGWATITGYEENDLAAVDLGTLLHLDYFKFPRDPLSSSRFLRKESNLDVLKDLQKVDEWGFGCTGEEVKGFFTHHIQHLDSRRMSPHDDALFDGIRGVLDPKLAVDRFPVHRLMKAMEYRLKLQSTVFECFAHLVDHTFIKISAVCQPFNLTSIDQKSDIAQVIKALHCFDFFRNFGDIAQTKEYLVSAGDGYIQVLIWFATVIVRGSIVQDFYGIMNALTATEQLGECDRAILEKEWPPSKLLRIDPHAGRVTTQILQNVFFCLPENVTTKALRLRRLRDDFDEQFKVAENIFFRYFGLPTDRNLPRERLPADQVARDMKEIDAIMIDAWTL